MTVPNAVAKMAAPASLATSDPASTPSGTSALSSSSLNLGDFAAQILEDIAPAASSAIGIGVEGLLATMPMGSVISEFIGPTTISGYVSQALTSLEAQISAGNVPVNPASYVETAAAALFNANESSLAKFLGESVEPTISALVAKIKF